MVKLEITKHIDLQDTRSKYLSCSFIRSRRTLPSGRRLDFGVVLQQGYRDADVGVLVLVVLVIAVQRTVDVFVQLLPTDRDLPEAFVSAATDPHE